MKVGSIRRVIIPPSQGYQNTLQEPIPPNVSSLFFRFGVKTLFPVVYSSCNINIFSLNSQRLGFLMFGFEMHIGKKWGTVGQ